MRAVARRVELPLASQPTLSRLENDVDWQSIRLLENEGLQWFCGVSHGRRRPEEIILDIDSTEDPTHGQQTLSFYNGLTFFRSVRSEHDRCNGPLASSPPHRAARSRPSRAATLGETPALYSADPWLGRDPSLDELFDLPSIEPSTIP